MLDLSYFNAASQGRCDVQTYNTPNAVPSAVAAGQRWTKPRGVTMAYILCVGAGAGGGAGFAANAGVGAGGGGGGGSGGIARLLIPAIFLPDSLSVHVGRGGAGVTSGTAASGSRSYVSVQATTVGGYDCILHSGTSDATGGVSSTSTAGGSPGSGSTVASLGSCQLAGAGLWQAVPGLNGYSGGAQGAQATAMDLLIGSGGQVGCITTGGSGGSGKLASNVNGPTTSSSAGTRLSESRLFAAVAPAGGSSGRLVGPPDYALFSFGGMGGSGNNTTVGGHGGHGGPGSGGGGGGAGVTTAGRGGDGGHGLIVIISW